MAPTKKKKKVAANPARGFATTSIAKKPEGIEVANLPEAPSSHTGSTTKLESRDGQGMPAVNGVEEKRQDLTPEEYEKELEASELQTIVDRFGGKVRKDAARQVAKLRTDRRQLRSQADPMNTVQWLPPELLNRALNLINKENEMATHQPVLDRGQSLKNIQEDEQLARLWTLQEILLKLGISRNIVQEMESDSIWGLNEALEWLASQCIASDLPDYEREQSKSTSEGPTVSSSGDDEAEGHIQNFSTERKREILQDTDDHPDEGSPAPETGESHDEFQNDLLSEMDSDLEPGELLSNYLSTKSSLYLLEPGTIATSVAKKKSNKGGQKRSTPKLPKAKALQRRLQKIESDILFDQDEADRAWPQRKIDLDIEQAHLKKARSVEKDSTVPGDPQGLADRERQDNEDIAAPEIFMKAEAQAKEDLETPELSEGDEMLGGLFPDNPDSSPVSTNQPVDASTPNSQGVEMTIRDFGKWTGISPRRVLEEACRSRDSKALLCFRHVSSTSFSHRHSVTISWSKDQDVPNFVSLHGVKVTLRPRETIISMISLSTPDSSQSESFLSTAALFVIFSSSPKEEKSFLRLPGVWKDLWTEFAETKKNYLDQNDRRTLEELREILRDSNANSNDLKDTDKDPLKIESPNKNIDGKDNTGVSIPSLEETSTPSVHLQNVWERIDSSNEYRNMLETRKQLPIWGFKEELLNSIESQQVTIICGQTGCGKSTQVPSFILEKEFSAGRTCNIYCTEPRRISAITLAQRVSHEIGQRVGTPGSLVGYAIRLESKMSQDTRLVYATTGIVMRMLESSNGLSDITHLILDEVHERTIDSDFLLIILRRLMVRRPELKVILMSATVDARKFSNYLGQAPIFNVPGRTFPVDTKFLEDAIEMTGYTIDDDNGRSKSRVELSDTEDEEIQDVLPSTALDQSTLDDLSSYSRKTITTLAKFNEYEIDYNLIGTLIEKVGTDRRWSDYSKAILVFLPGIAEIRKLNDIILGYSNIAADFVVFSLHSSIASEEQERAFQAPPKGKRKIVLATNIAETGVTIPDVTCVIDTGKHKEMRFDERRQLSRLIETFISQANAVQRRGRAGRVQEGLCFHLFTRARHDRQMAQEQTPEMLRLSLQDLVLRVKICELGDIEETLQQALSPPSTKNIDRAISALVDVKALTQAQELTPLGRQLAKLPLDVHLGKLLLLSCTFKCLDASLTIAAILSSKSPFSAPLGARKQMEAARMSFKRGDSDLLTLWSAYSAWRRICNESVSSENHFCRTNFLNRQALSNIEDLKQQLLANLVDAGFVFLSQTEKNALSRTRHSSNRRRFVQVPEMTSLNSWNDLVVNAVIAWSFYPKLLVRHGRGWRNVTNNQQVNLHPTSVNKDGADLKWLSFYHIMQSHTRYHAHETNKVYDLPVALLCGDAEFRMYAGVIILDGNRARFSVTSWKVMLVLKILRARLKQITAQSFKIPKKPLSAQHLEWLDIWQRMFDAKSEALKA